MLTLNVKTGMNKRDRADNGDDFQPVRDRRLQQMVLPGVGVKQRDGPEADQDIKCEYKGRRDSFGTR